MKRAKPLAFILAAYLILPLAIFDFTERASPFDEETFAGRLVAIGPRPRSWVPGATHGYDIPGGPDYDAKSWPFVVWKPVCLIYLKAKGFAPPAGWR